MEADFKVIAITPADPRPYEAVWIARLLDTHRADRVHIRHPRIDREAMAQLLGSIRPDLLSRVSIHDHHDLAAQFDEVGVHFNGRCPRREVKCTGLRSAGVHNADELDAARGLDYVLASPVFDSLSKTGYKANPDIDALAGKAEMPFIALGGVTPAAFDELKQRGYAGAAMLGYYQCKESGGLQFITNGATVADTVAQAAAVLEGGCRWVQVRMKDADADDVRQAVLRVAKLAAGYGARVIVDDRVELAAHSGVTGVHLGVGDMDPADARRILGPAKSSV